MVLLIVVATMIVWTVLRDREHDSARRDAQEAVEAAVARLDTGYQSTGAMLASAAALVGADGQIDRERLETFAELLIAGSPVNAVTYGPVVTREERAAFEARTGRPIRDRAADGTFVVAPDRDRYSPIAEAVAPIPMPNDILGFDFASDPERADTVAAAIASGTTKVTPVVRLAGTGRTGFIIVQPLNRPGDGRPIGLLTVGYDGGKVGTGILDGMPAGTSFRLTDAGQELYRSDDRVRPSFVDELPIGGRTWRFEYDTPLAVSRTLSTSVLLTGLGVAALVALAAVLAFRQERRLLLWRLQTALERDLAAELARAAGRSDVASTAAETIRVVASAKSVSLGLVEGSVLRLQHSTSVPGRVVDRWSELPLDRAIPITDAARTGRAVVLRDLDDLGARYPDLGLDPADGARAVACVPLCVGTESIGSLAFVFAESQPFDDVQLRWLAQIADMVAGALERARLYDHQTQTVLTLQRDLLPNDLPAHEGFALSAIYRPGDSAQVGGDWYDAFELPDGRLAIAIGDVAGRGVRAAATMGKLRHLIRACAGAYLEPSVVMAHANELICRGSAAVFATALYAVIEPDGTCTLSSAGHLPPLLTCDGEAWLTQVKPGPPLGVTVAATYHDSSISLRAGDALVLYTDGLVERRDEPLDESLELFAQVAATAPAECDAETLVDTVGSDDRDDVAVLLVRFAGVPEVPRAGRGDGTPVH